MNLSEIVSKLVRFKSENKAADKAEVERHLVAMGGFTKERPVYVGHGITVRVSEANTGTFSNTVLGLAKLQRYDSAPVVICIVRPDRLDFRLANATFLKKVSHTSHSLRLDNVRGSFLGNDIVDEYEGIPNRPNNFERLTAIHAEFAWVENLERLVGATNLIVAKLTRFAPSEGETKEILAAPQRAAATLQSDAFLETERNLIDVIERNGKELLSAAALDNGNIRGNRIEAFMTGMKNAHRLDDMVYPLANGRLLVDIKTKLLDGASAPKAYNIDKMLRLLAEPGSVFAFFFVGLNVGSQIAKCRLVSMFDPIIVQATRIQPHWSGRGSRGATQLTGEFSRVFDANYELSVDLKGSDALLRSFIEK